jgi:hypothetical protein
MPLVVVNDEDAADPRQAEPAPHAAAPAAADYRFRALISSAWAAPGAVNCPVTILPSGCNLDPSRDSGVMMPTSLNHLAMNRMLLQKPGLLQIGPASAAIGDRGPREPRLVPLCVTLPATVVVSLGLWAALIMGLRALF